MSDIQKAMALLITSFTKYSSRDGHKNTLIKEELKDLLQDEYGHMLRDGNGKDRTDKFFKQMDENKDDRVDFVEFVTMFACFTMIMNDSLHLE